VSHGRFNDFTEDERGIAHFALQQCAKHIMDRAAASGYPSEDLTQAAAMFHLASTLAGEVGLSLGEPALDAESLEMAAVCIAEGDAPFAARMAAEVEQEASA
jgi:hypothetical protein